MKGYAVICAVALVTTFACTPIVIWLAKRFGAVVAPSSDARHVHTKAMPTLGGAAMFMGFLAAMAVAAQMHQFRDMFVDNSEPVGLLLGAGVMFVTGALDDLIEVSPPAKLAGQVLAASLLWWFGIVMFFFRTPFNLFHTGVVVLSPDLQPLVTAAWVVLMTNAVNLIDGLDGLAAGIVGIAGFALFLFADRLFKAGYLGGDNIAPLVAIIIVGVCIGFLPFNWHPAKIIMGDAGALFLGVLLAVPTITIGGRTDFAFSGNTYFFFAPLAIPVIILGVPILDVVFSFFRRLIKRQHWHQADAGHLHHRLMRLGHGPRRTVAMLWTWTALLSAVALVPTYTKEGNAVVPFVVAGLALLLFAVFHPGAQEAKQAQERNDHPTGGASADAVVDLEQRRRRRA